MLQSLHSYRRPDISLNINSELEQPDFRKRFSSQDRSSGSPYVNIFIFINLCPILKWFWLLSRSGKKLLSDQSINFQYKVGTKIFKKLSRLVIIFRHNFRLSDFEAQNPPKLFSNASSSSLSSLSQKIPVPQNARNSSNTSECVYLGISLPKALAQFLMITEMTTDRREERKGLRKRGSLSFSEMEQVKELEEENVVSSSSSENSESEDSKSLKKSKSSKRIRHNATTCIACCTKVSKGKRQRKVSTGSFRLRTGKQ